MLYGSLIAGPLGFSLNPLHYAKKGIKAVGHEAAAGGKFVAHHAKSIAELAVLPIVELNKVVLGPVLHVALTPVRHKVDQLKDRRAKKLAWDRRHTTSPTAAERNEAKDWAKHTLRHEKIPFGPILSLLAGPSPAPLLFGQVQLGNLGDPTTATIISSIPVLLAIMKSVLSKNNASGEAPANPGGGAPAPGGAPPAAPGADASADAGGGDGGGGDAAGGDSSGGGGGGKHGKGGGAMILGMPKKYVIIGGAVLGGVLVLSLLTSKKGQ